LVDCGRLCRGSKLDLIVTIGSRVGTVGRPGATREDLCVGVRTTPGRGSDWLLLEAVEIVPIS
jgi:hypothetical protein